MSLEIKVAVSLVFISSSYLSPKVENFASPLRFKCIPLHSHSSVLCALLSHPSLSLFSHIFAPLLLLYLPFHQCHVTLKQRMYDILLKPCRLWRLYETMSGSLNGNVKHLFLWFYDISMIHYHTPTNTIMIPTIACGWKLCCTQSGSLSFWEGENLSHDSA